MCWNKQLSIMAPSISIDELNEWSDITELQLSVWQHDVVTCPVEPGADPLMHIGAQEYVEIDPTVNFFEINDNYYTFI